MSGNRGLLKGSIPLDFARSSELSAVLTVSEVGLEFGMRFVGGTIVLLVPESTLIHLIRAVDFSLTEVADLAIDSEKSESESDSQARLVRPLAICLMIESSLLLRSLFFF